MCVLILEDFDKTFRRFTHLKAAYTMCEKRNINNDNNNDDNNKYKLKKLAYQKRGRNVRRCVVRIGYAIAMCA